MLSKLGKSNFPPKNMFVIQLKKKIKYSYDRAISIIYGKFKSVSKVLIQG